MERLLESIEPFYRKVHVTVFEDHPYIFRVQGHQIFIGAKLLQASGHLEKAIAKVWYRERNETLFAQQSLMEEIFTDFVLYLQNGELDIADPVTQVKTALQNAKWPYVIKSATAYCDSPWKQSEHYALCRNPQELKDLGRSNCRDEFATPTRDKLDSLLYISVTQRALPFCR